MNENVRIDHSGATELRPAVFMEDHRATRHLDLKQLWQVVRRNRTLIAGILAFAILATLVVTLLTRPKFTAISSIQIEQQAAKVLGSEDTSAYSTFADADRFLETQIDILKSRSLALRVANSMRLEQGDGFLLRMGVTPTLAAMTNPSERRERVLRLLQDNLQVELPRNSRVAQIRFVSPDPVLAAAVANMFADDFITANLQRRYDTTAYARSFLERRLDEVRQRLQASERDMIGYARRAQLIDASNAASTDATTDSAAASGPKSLTIAELVQLSNASTQAQTARVAAEERWKQASRTPLLDLPEVLSNPTIEQLTQQKSQLVAAYEEDKQRRKAEYPTMLQEAARIAELERQINQVALNIRDSIRGSYQTALNQEKALTGDVQDLKAATLSEQNRSIRYNILKRDVDTNRALYDGLLQRYKEVSAEAGVTSNNISIVDRADVPLVRTSPRLSTNLAIALLLAVAVAGGLVFGREKFDDRIRSPEDVPNKLDVPLLGTLPIVADGRTPLEELEQPRSDLAEAYQALRTALELSTREGVPRTLLVTSSRPSEGKSTSAFAIARTFARLGRDVVLIDGDMRRPALHRMLGLKNEIGLSSLLARQQEIEAALQPTGVDRLQFIGSGPHSPNPAELLTMDALTGLFARLRANHDLIIVDGPPVLGLADAVQLANATDGTVFLVEANSGHFGGVKASLRRIGGINRTVLGVVLNKFDHRQADYSYSYNYNYRYSQDVLT